MIDDHTEAMDLMRKMEAQLPIPARATKAFIHLMRKNGIKVTPNQTIQIESVFYLGDEGGIACGVGQLGQKKTVTVSSLTHLRVGVSHALAKEIRAYQIKRSAKIAKMDGQHRSGSLTVRPRRKVKKRRRH